MPCLNCDQPTILTNFGVPWTGMFNRSPRFLHIGGICCRSFIDDSVADVAGWMAANLDAETRPDCQMVWGQLVQRDETLTSGAK